MENYSKEQLINILTDDDNSDEIRNKAGELLATKNPSNDDLKYILEYVSDTEIRNKAGELLATKNPSNDDLKYILRWVSDTEIRNKAWELLATKNPSNDDLKYILRWVSDTEISNKAGILLRMNLGVHLDFDEKAQMVAIAKEVIARPGSLKMSDWHCGTSHCIAGWLCVLNEDAQKIEEEHSTEIAGAAFLPSFVPLFFKSDQEALEVLTQIANETETK